ncbi:uncharacterized protein LOC131852301 [Achroia grisella]|uniref:uncharacterized protein LOC131852301 n=1 Tax=Achroia grisella TaxID=688607 RepID=UPI0027D31B9A|nr:uncharacterized protein LOC131852301 [Achroia grisella]
MLPVLFLVATYLCQNAAPYQQYEDPEDGDGSDDDFDDHYEEEAVIPATAGDLKSYDIDFSKMRRYNTPPRTLSPQEIKDVKGALKQILADREIDNQLTLIHTDTTVISRYTETERPDTVTEDQYTGLTKLQVIDEKIYDDLIDELINNVKRDIATDKQTILDVTTLIDENGLEFTLPSRSSWVPLTRTPSLDEVHRQETDETNSMPRQTDVPVTSPLVTDISFATDVTTETVNLPDDIASSKANTLPEVKLETSASITDASFTTFIVDNSKSENYDETTTQMNIYARVQATTDRSTNCTSTGSALDVPALLDIISNLTYDYESNLTRMFNETLRKYNIPTCKTPTEVEETTTFPTEDDFQNATVVAKCFVCGLDVTAVPQNAYCADAFAGDFLPLVPVDPRARGHIARYRKYCRYLDVNKYITTDLEPRSVFGRFTGGCSVRWVDLSGIYTQRTCRNRQHAVMGKHYGSKRMAKLEMALKDVDNGCLISPMASLVPFSRGVSLYARFHACVCTGNWCNSAISKQPWMVTIFVLSYTVLITE